MMDSTSEPYLAAQNVEILCGTEDELFARFGAATLQHEENLSPKAEAILIAISVFLVIFSGLCAGLTLGLLSLSRVDVELKKRTGNANDRWLAEKVERVICNPHWLLVTLLLCNAGCMESLPLFLDRLLNPAAALVLSVSVVLIFGEIVPQAICKRFGMQVGARLAWLVIALMWVTAPISWPLGQILDWLLGEETALFRRAELRELVALHAEPDEHSGGASMLTAAEVNVIHGALDAAHKTAEAAMTPLANVFSLEADARMDRSQLQRITAAGHSRVPVFEGEESNIVGLILVKELVNYLVFQEGDINERTVRECGLREIEFLRVNTPLYSVIELFKLKKRHMAVLVRPAGGAGGAEEVPGTAKTPGEGKAVGIITIEDVIEEILQGELVDETDLFVDNLQTVEVPATPLDEALPEGLHRYLYARAAMRQLSGNRRSVTTTADGGVGAAAAEASARPAALSPRKKIKRNNDDEGIDKSPLLDV